jgi:TPR repeat protein
MACSDRFHNVRALFTNHFSVLLLAITIALASCTNSTDSQRSGNSESSESSEGFLIVDCLLPGQVRKLGSNMTYLSPRRPIKTSAGDCEIRGGEYVAYDRADYSTALKIWLPLAKEGDADAQSYAGEIYEKGLGLAPDYQLAAFWYQKAALQGHSRGQINLGHLYELGLGVPRDAQQALNLYRQASGINNDDLLFASTLVSTHVTRQDYESAQSSLAEEMQRNEAMQQELNSLNQQVASKSQSLGAAEQKLAGIEKNLIVLTDAPTAAPASTGPSGDEQALQREVDTLATSQQRLQADIATLQQENQKLAALNEQQKTELNQVSQQSAEQTSEKRQEQARLIEEQARLAAQLTVREQELAETHHQMLISKAALQMERFRMSEALDASAENQARARQQQAELAELRAQLEQQYQVVKEQRGAIEQLEQRRADEAAALLVAAAPATIAPSEANPPSIEIIEPPVVLVRSMPTVTLLGNDGEREIVGRVNAPGGILSLTINGQSTDFEDNNLFRSRITIDQQPKPVEVVVVDKQGQRAKVAFTFVEPATRQGAAAATVSPAKPPANPPPARLELGDYYALIVGNNNYQHFSTLASAVNDARATDRVLREKYNFKTRLLLNADRYTILSELNALREQLDSNDNLLIYYAGHGVLDETNERGYWLPVDADPNNNANWISNTAITDILNAIEAKHILVIADSCFSGTLTQTPLARTQADIPASVRTEWIKVMTETRARITLTSGGVEPVLDGGGGSHSIFAKAFLDTLRSNDRIMEGYSLYYQILDRLDSTNSPAGQVPRYAPIHLAGHESGEFFFNPVKS